MMKLPIPNQRFRETCGSFYSVNTKKESCEHKQRRARINWSEATNGNKQLVSQFEATDELFSFKVCMYVSSKVEREKLCVRKRK